MEEHSKNWPVVDQRLTVDQYKGWYNEFRVVFRDYNVGPPLPTFEELLLTQIGKLEAALAVVAYESAEGYRFKSGAEATLAYLFFVNREHFLTNGNKRASLIAALGYLRQNNHWLRVDWRDLYKIATEIAGEKGRKMNLIFEEFTTLIDASIINFTDESAPKLSNTISRTWTPESS